MLALPLQYREVVLLSLCGAQQVGEQQQQWFQGHFLGRAAAHQATAPRHLDALLYFLASRGFRASYQGRPL